MATMNKESERAKGRGMTSQRARDRLVPMLQEQGVRDMLVLMAIRQGPRHLYVDEALASRAYENNALPIAAGQTISQPFIVARMTELLLEKSPKKVLEVGTGSGYQASVLAQLVPEVYTVERIERLYQKASDLFDELGYENIHCQYSDGGWGWPDEAPFDAIIVTAAPEEVPDELLQQLKPGGQLVIPVGGQGDLQQLRRVTRIDDGTGELQIESEDFGSVVFVPMIQGEVE